jgi:hypothetical protein
MRTTQSLLVSSALIAAAILVHGYATRPPQYQFSLIQRSGYVYGVIRGNSRTGDIVVCERDDDAEDTTYPCSR